MLLKKIFFRFSGLITQCTLYAIMKLLYLTKIISQSLIVYDQIQSFDWLKMITWNKFLDRPTDSNLLSHDAHSINFRPSCLFQNITVSLSKAVTSVIIKK